MSTVTLDAREVSIPMATVTSLESVLGDESPRLLVDLGQETGEGLADAMTHGLGTEPNQLSMDRFWFEVSEFFSSRGWLTLEWEQPHPGVGLLRAKADSDNPFPDRFFAATLEGFISSVVGSRVVVMTVSDQEVPGEIVFAVGNAQTLSRLNEELNEAALALADALERV